MTRTIAFMIGIASVALAVAAPTAFAEGRLAGSPSQEVSSIYVDAGERAAAARSELSVPSMYVDAGERGAGLTAPVTVVAATGPGDAIEWPQLGIGFAGGLVLALGLLLAFRAARPRVQVR